jgi:hypothetical protein
VSSGPDEDGTGNVLVENDVLIDGEVSSEPGSTERIRREKKKREPNVRLGAHPRNNRPQKYVSAEEVTEDEDKNQGAVPLDGSGRGTSNVPECGARTKIIRSALLSENASLGNFEED